eukprot:18457_1
MFSSCFSHTHDVENTKPSRISASECIPSERPQTSSDRLIEATRRRDFLEIKRVLLEDENVDMNARTPNGFTPLLLACQYGNVDIVKLLLNKNTTDVNAENKWNDTALIKAVQKGHSDIVKEILKHRKDGRANVDHGNYCGDTALILSAYKGWYDICRLLVENSDQPANIHVVDKEGRTALDWSRRKGRTLCANYLEEETRNQAFFGMLESDFQDVIPVEIMHLVTHFIA